MRKQIVAGNWKMNKNYSQGLELVNEVLTALPEPDANKELIFAPPFIHLHGVSEQILGQAGVRLSSQNCHYEASGAFTGEISTDMLLSCGVQDVIIGHSERREYFNESDELLLKKVDAALSAGLRPIFCCGESLDIRKSGEHISFVTRQIENSLFHLSEEQISGIVIAYEPIWAIGTGETASADQAQEMHAAIRAFISKRYNDTIADGISILYGGSVKPNNAEEIFSKEDVDGGLIGGASLKAQDFLSIYSSLS